MSDTNDQLRKRIEELIPINELTPNLQKKLLERAQILEVKKSRFIFKQGDKDDYSYYLLEGEVELHANKQLDSVIESSSDRAKYALAQLQPRQFSVKAKTAIKVLLIERKNLDQLMLLAQESTLNPTLTSANSEMEVDIVDGVDDDTDWMTMMLQSELFSRIPTANIHQLFALLEPIDFNAGDVVINQGDPGEHYYIISEGRCAVSRKPTPQSKDVKLAELKVGDSFGEEALISESTRNATVTMMTKGVLMQLAKDTFVELVKNPTLQSLKFDEADALVNEGSAKWLDVRFPNEHKESSIEDSINVPLNSLRLQIDKLDTSLIYILYCDTGGRSSTGTFLLAERGFDVTYLDGGLVNNPEAVGVQTVVPKVAEPAKQAEKVETEHVEARVEKLNAELETTQIRMDKAKEADVEADANKQKEAEDNKKKLEEEKKKLEAQKKVAEAEAKKKTEQEEARLKKLQAESDQQMQEEKKKLEEIYNKNAQDMEKLQKAKEAAEENIRKEREALEKQAEEAKKQIEEAKRLRQEADEAARKQLEAVEASKKKLEEEGKKKRLEEEERERQLQAEAKAEIDEERKKMAEQYERNNKEFEELKRLKEEAEAAKLGAKQEAQKMIDEYKQSHDKTHAEEEAKLKVERLKLEEEAKGIQVAMKQIQQAKLEAEKIKQEALEQAKVLKEKQMESTNTKEQRAKLETEIKVVEEKVVEAEREIEDAEHREKLTESAQQVNEADLIRKKKQEERFRAQIAGDLEAFEDEQQEEAASITQIQMQTDMMKRIKLKAAEAKKNAATANENLLDDISKQLGKD